VFGPIERRRGQVPTGAAGSCTEVLIDTCQTRSKTKHRCCALLEFVGLESMTACIFENEKGVSYGIMCRLSD
jgi:hypothetical protein